MGRKQFLNFNFISYSHTALLPHKVPKASTLVASAFLFVLLPGCGVPISTEANSALSSQVSSSTVVVTPGSETVATGTTIQFTATGGTAPYTYSIIGSSDTTAITSTGLFTAPTTATVLLIGAEDANQSWGYSTITVGNTTGTSTSILSISAIVTGAVQINCDANQEVYNSGSGQCGDGTAPSLVQNGDGEIAECASSTMPLAANLNCANSFTSGTTYTRSISATAIHTLTLYCSAGETASFREGICGSSIEGGSFTIANGMNGYTVDCPANEAVAIAMNCSGTAK